MQKQLPDLGVSLEEVHWELTNHCNFACVHCYLADDPRPELSTAEIFRLLDEMEKAGVLYLTLSGGEPLLRKDFPEIYRHAHSKGFLINVFTNGSKITDAILALFLELPPQKVEITLNGISAETFEKVTAVKGSFAKTMDGIKRLAEAGIFLGLKTNGMNLNAHEALEIKAFAQSLPNTFFKFDTAIMPKRDKDTAPLKYRLGPKEIFQIYRADPEMQETISSECSSMKMEAPPERKMFQCAAAETRFHISAWGDLHPCHTVRPIRASLKEKSFLAAVKEVQSQVRALYYPKESACGSCKIFSQCDSCPGLADLEGKKDLPTSYHCDVAHETVKSFGHLPEDKRVLA